MKFRLPALTTALFSLFLYLNHAFEAVAVSAFCTTNGKRGVNTALGCISTEVEGTGSFFVAIMRVAVGVGGGLALLLMLYGIFIVTTSAGMPDKLKEGKEIITSAISGLIFIILSVFLLRTIGVNILGLPGLK